VNNIHRRYTMKKILTVAALAVALSGCGGFNKNECREAVVKKFNTQNVFTVSDYKFVGKDNAGNLWHVETMNLNDTVVTKQIPIFFGEIK
jgi:hypothetical protein